MNWESIDLPEILYILDLVVQVFPILYPRCIEGLQESIKEE